MRGVGAVDMGTEAEVVDMVDGTTVRETLRTEMVRMVAAGGMATAAHLEDVEITVEEDLPMGWVHRDRHTRTRLRVIMDGEGDIAHINRVRRMEEIQPPSYNGNRPSSHSGYGGGGGGGGAPRGGYSSQGGDGYGGSYGGGRGNGSGGGNGGRKGQLRQWRVRRW